MLERYSHILEAAKIDAMNADKDRSAFPCAGPEESPKASSLVGARVSVINERAVSSAG